MIRLEAALFTGRGDDDYFDLHPLPMQEFLAGISSCGEPGSFIDLGCGVGTKLAVAHFLGWHVAGVERQHDYASTASRVVAEADIIVADARDVPLSQYDVVYSYRLCVDLDAQQQLNEHIVARMRRGALYFCAGSDPVGLDPVGPGVWRV